MGIWGGAKLSGSFGFNTVQSTPLKPFSQVNADWRGVHMPALVSAAYGGTVVDAARLCAARPPEAREGG